MSLTSDELNFLIHRYLVEAGFRHSAFTFATESSVERGGFNSADVAAGALITLVQKGLQYQQIELHIDEAGVEMQCEAPFSATQPHICVRSEKMDIFSGDLEVQNDDAVSLEGHSSEVFVCSWNPVHTQILATGSGDSTARMWKVPESANGVGSLRVSSTLQHYDESCDDEIKDVTTICWSGDGTKLATGSYDGVTRIWNTKGTLILTLKKHVGPIFSLKWNPTGNFLLSGCVDKSAIVWDVSKGSVVQQFSVHSSAVLDVAWKDDSTFATCSSDHNIYVCQVGSTKPLYKWSGHTNEVNAIRWDPSGNLLASCSDDNTAKIWSVTSSSCLVHDLREHTKEIYTIEWAPFGPKSANPSQASILASASFDSTVKLWDVERGESLYTLSDHKQAVYSVSFSPDGKYLASGSFDKCVMIWSVRDGKLLKRYEGTGGIFELDWSEDGNQVAACFSDGSVNVVDIRL